MKNSIYGLKIILLTSLLVLGLSWVGYQILGNYSTKSLFVNSHVKNGIYILNSSLSRQEYKKYGSDTYTKRLNLLTKKLQESNNEVTQISEKQLAKLESDMILIVFDAISLRKESIENIKKFTKDGGFLIFNYNFGFNEGSKYIGAKNIEDISSLKHIKEPYFLKDESLFIVNRLLSPLSTTNPIGKLIRFKPYDALNLYSSKTVKPDIFLTNENITQAKINDSYNLEADELGVAWHGSFGKGNWVYFSFPSYIFFESHASELFFKDTFDSILQYAKEEAIIQPYPYLDYSSIIFISENTEYQFAKLKNLVNVAIEYNTPVTIFCNSNLSKKYPKLIQEVSEEPLIEIASISEDLNQTGENYLLKDVKDRTYPLYKKKLWHLFRLGTDDYRYMVKEAWNADAMLERIYQDTEFITAIDGIYNLNLHTHLLANDSNIDVIKKYMLFINSHKNLHSLNAKEIVSRIQSMKRIEIKLKVTSKNYLISVKNLNPNSVKNYRFRLYWPHAQAIKSIRSDIIGVDVSFSSNIVRRYSDVTVKLLAANSPMLLMIEYKKE